MGIVGLARSDEAPSSPGELHGPGIIAERERALTAPLCRSARLSDGPTYLMDCQLRMFEVMKIKSQDVSHVLIMHICDKVSGR